LRGRLNDKLIAFFSNDHILAWELEVPANVDKLAIAISVQFYAPYHSGEHPYSAQRLIWKKNRAVFKAAFDADPSFPPESPPTKAP
jgi:hypothetical protein